MTKYKKILLSSLSMVGLAAIVPTIITSCGANSTLNNSSTTDKPQQPGKPQEPQDPSNPERPNLVGDETNKKEFTPSQSKLYQSVVSSLDLVSPEQTETKVNQSVSSYSAQAEKEDISDFIKMWSFNKWFVSTNSNESLKSMVSRLENLQINKSGTAWDISFNYQIELVSSDNSKIFVNKNYHVNTSSLSNVVFSADTTKFEINNQSQLNKTMYKNNLIKNTNLIDTVKKFTEEKTSIFNAKNILNEFLNKKEIKGTYFAWKDSLKTSGVSLSEHNTNLNIDLNKISSEWNGLKKDMTKEQIENTLFNSNSTTTSGVKLYTLKDNFREFNSKENVKQVIVTEETSKNEKLCYKLQLLDENQDSYWRYIFIENHKTIL